MTKKIIKNTKVDKYWKQTRSTIKNTISGVSNLDDLEEIEIEDPEIIILQKEEEFEDKRYIKKNNKKAAS